MGSANKNNTVVETAPSSLAVEAEKSAQFTEYEHSLGFWEAVKLHWPAVAWAVFINLVRYVDSIERCTVC
jgi:hypothetical protein